MMLIPCPPKTSCWSSAVAVEPSRIPSILSLIPVRSPEVGFSAVLNAKGGFRQEVRARQL